MARPNYSFQKRQKELARKKKKELKRQRKQEKDTPPPEDLETSAEESELAQNPVDSQPVSPE